MSIRLLSRDFAAYGLLDFVQRALTVLLVPIYTRVLSQSEFGTLDLILTVFSVLTVFSDVQLLSGFSRFYPQERRKLRGPEFGFTVLTVRTGLGVVGALLFVVLGASGALEKEFIPSFREYSREWSIVALTVPATFAYEFLLLQAQLLRRRKQFAVGALTNTSASTLLAVLLTVVVPMGIAGVLIGQLVGKIFAVVELGLALRDELTPQLKIAALGETMRYSIPLVPGWWLGFSSAYVGRFFVYAEQGPEQNAVLAITVKVAAVLGLFCTAFRSAWHPLAMSYIGDTKAEEFYVASTRVFMSGGVVAAFGLTAASPWIVAVLAPGAYATAVVYVPVFLIGTLVSELATQFAIGSQIARRTGWISIAAGLGIMANVGLLYSFTSRLGIYAVGAGLVTAACIRAAATYFAAQRSHKIAYDQRALGLFVAACCLLGGLSVVRGAGAIGDAGFLTALVLAGGSLGLGILEASERAQLRRVAQRGVASLTGLWSGRP